MILESPEFRKEFGTTPCNESNRTFHAAVRHPRNIFSEDRILDVQHSCNILRPNFTEEASIRADELPHRVRVESTFGACIRSPAAFLQNSPRSHLAQSPSGMMEMPPPRRKSHPLSPGYCDPFFTSRGDIQRLSPNERSPPK